MNRIYKDLLVTALQQMASYDFQKIAWFKNDQGLRSSFEEDYFAVFDDTGLAYALEHSDVVFGKEADNALHDLDDATNAVDEFLWTPEEILNSPEMQVVREKATTALKFIQESKAEGVTVEFVEVGQPL